MRFFVFLLMVVSSGPGRAATLDPGLIANPAVDYKKFQSFASFPSPVVAFRKEAILSEREKTAIFEQLLYPLVCRCPEPIAAILVEGQADAGSRFSLEVLYTNGKYHGLMISWLAPGQVDPAAVEQLLRNPLVD